MRVLLSRDIDGAAGDVYYLEMAGISSETKPTTNVATGSKFYEVDTDTNYVYDEDSGDWTETPSVADDVNDLKSAINVLTPAATASDVGKFLKVKTVADGVPTSFEYGEGGSGGNVIDDTAGTGVTNKTWSADKLTTMLGDIETLLAAI